MRDLHKKEEIVLQFSWLEKHLQENKNNPSKHFTLMCDGIFKKRTQNVGGM